MAPKILVKVEQHGDRYTATCVESDVVGEGATPDEAVRCLREGLISTLRTEAVAPPSSPPEPQFELVVDLVWLRGPASREGPGEA